MADETNNDNNNNNDNADEHAQAADRPATAAQPGQPRRTNRTLQDDTVRLSLWLGDEDNWRQLAGLTVPEQTGVCSAALGCDFATSTVAAVVKTVAATTRRPLPTPRRAQPRPTATSDKVRWLARYVHQLTEENRRMAARLGQPFDPDGKLDIMLLARVAEGEAAERTIYAADQGGAASE